MDSALEAEMKVFIRKVSPVYRERVREILDKYIGPVPQTFESGGKKYTPVTWAAQLGINPDDYIELSSYTHHPWYKPFRLEVPDNWMSGLYYNVPPDELLQIMEYSLKAGYTFCWDGDMSDDKNLTDKYGITRLENEKSMPGETERQEAFDRLIVTDDHLMHITGIAKDKDGNQFFITKNSWGTNLGDQGYLYLSVPFVRLKTIAILVNKNAIPDSIRKKLGI